MKRISALLALGVLASGSALASQAGTYDLVSVYYGNAFTGATPYYLGGTSSIGYTITSGNTSTFGGAGNIVSGAQTGGALGSWHQGNLTSATATDDGSGNISISGASGLWSVAYASQHQYYNFAGNATTTLGGSSINWNSVTCTYNAGNTTGVCGDAYDGIGGYTGTNPSGSTTATWATGLGQDGSACTACSVSVTEAYSAHTGTTELFVNYKFGLTNSGTTTSFQSYTLEFAPIPVPGAVWLFGSALGLLGLRRKSA